MPGRLVVMVNGFDGRDTYVTSLLMDGRALEPESSLFLSGEQLRYFHDEHNIPVKASRILLGNLPDYVQPAD